MIGECIVGCDVAEDADLEREEMDQSLDTMNRIKATRPGEWSL